MKYLVFLPDGTRAALWDDATRTFTDFTADPPTSRPYTAEEDAAADARLVEATTYEAREANGATLRARALDALAQNKAFLAVDAPTNAQALAQIRLLTREVSALIRLTLGALDSTD